jgi:tetratricopeptide (TPR) repeat protein
VAEARNLVALLPESPRAHVALGYALSGALDHAGGADAARKAIALDARFGPVLNLLGYELLQQGKVPEAIDALQKYAAVTPQSRTHKTHWATHCSPPGRYADGEAAFRKAVEISPTLWNGFEGIACAKFYQGDFAGARQAFDDGRQVTADRPAERATLEQVAVFEALAEDKPEDAMKLLDDVERIPNLTPDRLTSGARTESLHVDDTIRRRSHNEGSTGCDQDSRTDSSGCDRQSERQSRAISDQSRDGNGGYRQGRAPARYANGRAV